MRRSYIAVNGKWVPKEQVLAERAAKRMSDAELAVLGDIPPDQAFVSPVDGSYVTSRAQLREHNIRNNVSDVGNDPHFTNPKPRTYRRESAAPTIAKVLRGEIPIQRGTLPDGFVRMLR